MFWNLQVFGFVADLCSLPVYTSVHLNHFSTDFEFSISVVLTELHDCTVVHFEIKAATNKVDMATKPSFGKSKGG